MFDKPKEKDVEFCKYCGHKKLRKRKTGMICRRCKRVVKEFGVDEEAAAREEIKREKKKKKTIKGYLGW